MSKQDEAYKRNVAVEGDVVVITKSSAASSSASLVDDRLAVLTALRQAYTAMLRTAPHGRDYQHPSGGWVAHVFADDRDLFSRRLAVLRDLMTDVEAEALAIQKEGGR